MANARRRHDVNDHRMVARAVHRIATFFVIARGHKLEPKSRNDVTTWQVRAPLFAALYALGYEDMSVSRLLAGEIGRAELMARIHVDHGDNVVEQFEFWMHYQGLLSVMNHCRVEPQSPGFMRELLDSLGNLASQLGIIDGLRTPIEGILSVLGRGTRVSSRRVELARGILIGRFTTAAEERLGLIEVIRAHPPEAYLSGRGS